MRRREIITLSNLSKFIALGELSLGFECVGQSLAEPMLLFTL